jgi:hypothetical protein
MLPLAQDQAEAGSGDVILVSANAAGTQGNGSSQSSMDISDDGRYVAFSSLATNLASTPTSGQQIFRKELVAPYTFYFAEGYTGDGFEEWLCIQNPGASPANVLITYYRSDGAPIDKPQPPIGANSRYTVLVNSDAGNDLLLSTRILSDQPILVERPMYFNFQGHWTGGHDVVSYIP